MVISLKEIIKLKSYKKLFKMDSLLGLSIFLSTPLLTRYVTRNISLLQVK